MKRAINTFALIALGLLSALACLHSIGRSHLPEAEAQNFSNRDNWEDSRSWLAISGTMTSISTIDTANYVYSGEPGGGGGAYAAAANGRSVNHVIKGGTIGGATAGLYKFYNSTTMSAAAFIFAVDVPANTTLPLPAEVVQKGIAFGIGNPITCVGPGVCEINLWVRDDPK